MEAKVYSKRLRMIAGPNGSGKSTIINLLSSEFDTGIYLNADDIEAYIKQNSYLELTKYNLNNINPNNFNLFLQNHTLKIKAEREGYKIDIEIDGDKLIFPNNINSYHASIIVDFIRSELISLGKKLTFETVMSHHSKIDVLKSANNLEYKSYLYFVGTDSEEINVRRVEERTKKGGHFVSPDKIRSRYLSTMKLLKEAVKNTYRSFIFDNSGKEPILILEIFKGHEITYHYDEIPQWLDKYLLNSN